MILSAIVHKNSQWYKYKTYSILSNSLDSFESYVYMACKTDTYKHRTVTGLSPKERLYEVTLPSITRNVSMEPGRSFSAGQKLNVNIFNNFESFTPWRKENSLSERKILGCATVKKILTFEVISINNIKHVYHRRHISERHNAMQ